MQKKEVDTSERKAYRLGHWKKREDTEKGSVSSRQASDRRGGE